jgi:hypothetical protein
MRDEVEEFLRRVAQMRAAAEAQAKTQQQRPTPVKPAPAPPRPVPPQRLVPARQEVVYVEPAEAQVVDAEISDRAAGLSRRVAQDLRGSEQIAEHTRHLGEEVDLADDKLKARLHQVFDHQIGSLKTSTMEAAATLSSDPAAEGTAGGMMQMLRSPQSVRDAIVMAEILRRPEDLW